MCSQFRFPKAPGNGECLWVMFMLLTKKNGKSHLAETTCRVYYLLSPSQRPHLYVVAVTSSSHLERRRHISLSKCHFVSPTIYRSCVLCILAFAATSREERSFWAKIGFLFERRQTRLARFIGWIGLPSHRVCRPSLSTHTNHRLQAENVAENSPLMSSGGKKNNARACKNRWTHTYILSGILRHWDCWWMVSFKTTRPVGFRSESLLTDPLTINTHLHMQTGGRPSARTDGALPCLQSASALMDTSVRTCKNALFCVFLCLVLPISSALSLTLRYRHTVLWPASLSPQYLLSSSSIYPMHLFILKTH